MATLVVNCVEGINVPVNGLYSQVSCALLGVVADQVNEELLHDSVLLSDVRSLSLLFTYELKRLVI